jgi:DNA repair protein RadC
MKKNTRYKKDLKKAYTVRDLPKSERPRERLREFGPSSLSEQELLAIILGSGTQGESVIVKSQKLLSRFGSLKKVVEASIEELQEENGIGPARATQLLACFEIARRVNKSLLIEEQEGKSSQAITSPDEIVGLIRSKISDFSKEQFLVISLDTRNRPLGINNVSVGTLTASLVHPRETFECAIRKHAASIIVSHNHPSGDEEPSEEDIKITQRLKEAGKIMGIELLDHIVVTKGGYCSMKEKGMV